jgi:hypothetical protein
MKNVFKKVWGYVLLLLIINGSVWGAASQFFPTISTRQVTCSGGISGKALTINGGKADSDSIIYGTNSAGAVVVDAGNNRVGIFTAAPTAPLDVTGAIKASTTITAGTGITVTSGSVQSPNVNATATFTYKGQTYAPIMSLKNDATTGVAASNTATLQSASTVVIPANGLTVGQSMYVNCYGTSGGTTTTKIIGLYAGSTAIATMTTQIASTGAWQASFSTKFTATTTQLTDGMMVIAGGSVDGPVGVHASTSVNVNLAHTYTVKINNGAKKAAASITVYQCNWSLRP